MEGTQCHHHLHFNGSFHVNLSCIPLGGGVA